MENYQTGQDDLRSPFERLPPKVQKEIMEKKRMDAQQAIGVRAGLKRHYLKCALWGAGLSAANAPLAAAWLFFAASFLIGALLAVIIAVYRLNYLASMMMYGFAFAALTVSCVGMGMYPFSTTLFFMWVLYIVIGLVVASMADPFRSIYSKLEAKRPQRLTSHQDSESPTPDIEENLLKPILEQEINEESPNDYVDPDELFNRLPPDVQQEFREKRQKDNEKSFHDEKTRIALTRRLVALGAAFGMFTAILNLDTTVWFVLLNTILGAGLAFFVADRRISPMLSALFFGGSFIALCAICIITGLLPLSVYLCFDWPIFTFCGAIIAYVYDPFRTFFDDYK